MRRKKLIALTLVLGMNYAGLSTVGRTAAYFNDTETSTENFFSATELDFTAMTTNTVFGIGKGESVHRIIRFEGTTTNETLFSFRGEFSTPDNCAGLEATLTFRGMELYRGALTSLSGATTTKNIREVTIDELNIDIREMTEGGPDYGSLCDWRLVFDGAQFPLIENGGGFNDTETQIWSITFRKQIVLNEFLPNPTGSDSANMPNGEWIELYNNGDAPRDLSGWYTRDATDGEGNRVFVTALNTLSATTTIAAHGWLVVYMNKAILNNDGDTVRLFDSSGSLIDSHSYGTAPENKSFARIPDGVGEWVDPVPTPGEPNIADDTETIAAVSDPLLVETASTSEAVLESEESTTTPDTVVIPEVPEVKEEKIEEGPAVVPAEETEAIDEPIIYREETDTVILEETDQPEN